MHISELHAVLLEAVVTGGTAALCWYFFAEYRRRDLLWWSTAWSLYLVRILAISAFLASGKPFWLFIHQVLTGSIALVLLWAATTFSTAAPWRPWYAVTLAFPIVWSYVAIYQLESFLLAALPAVLFLSFATMWTSAVFWRRWRISGSRGAAVLAAVLAAWAIHHLDYPLLRARGNWNPWGYYLDILFVLAMGIGIVILVLEELDRRTTELARLSARMVQQHEEERRRVSLELHDQTAQVWAAVKMQLGLVRESAPAALAPRLDRVLDLVDKGIGSIRNVTTDLRPPLLDDLGLVPALRALAESFAEQSHLNISFSANDDVPDVSSEAGVALFRALQEALSNVARHSGATQADVRLTTSEGRLTLVVQDNGRGFSASGVSGSPRLGLAGMRERIAALKGSVDVETNGGASITVRVPLPHPR